MTSIDEIYKIANGLECTALKAVSMSELTSFRIGGPAELLIKPDSSFKFQLLLKACYSSGLNVFTFGRGSNILVSDNGIKGVVFCTSEMNSCENAGNGILECDAGVSLSYLCSFALENELTGLEFAFGIPGSIGGAVYMNAGAYGGEIKDILQTCTHLNNELNFETVNKDFLEFGYRKSSYSTNCYTITSLNVKLNSGDKVQIKQKMNEIMNCRKNMQPLEFPSAGSVFKRPKDSYAGHVIEECGLKGKRIGDAEVSEKHAGFIINKGNATASDVLNLIEYIQETVLREKGIILETEIKCI